jgi:hypothetical protein
MHIIILSVGAKASHQLISLYYYRRGRTLVDDDTGRRKHCYRQRRVTRQELEMRGRSLVEACSIEPSVYTVSQASIRDPDEPLRMYAQMIVYRQISKIEQNLPGPIPVNSGTKSSRHMHIVPSRHKSSSTRPHQTNPTSHPQSHSRDHAPKSPDNRENIPST